MLGLFFQDHPLKYGVLVNFQPNQPLVPAIQFSPNAAAVTISVDPNATLAPVINNTPGQPKPIGVITDPIAPGVVVVGQDPKAPAVTTVVQSPNAPCYYCRTPAQQTSCCQFWKQCSYACKHYGSKRSKRSHNYSGRSLRKQCSSYRTLGDTPLCKQVTSQFSYLLDLRTHQNEPDYPLGYENEIVKIQKYLSSTGGPFDLLQTDDGLIGGTETAQIFELSDRGSTWEYVEFANTPLASDYSLYRGITRPPLAPAFVGIASETKRSCICNHRARPECSSISYIRTFSRQSLYRNSFQVSRSDYDTCNSKRSKRSCYRSNNTHPSCCSTDSCSFYSNRSKSGSSNNSFYYTSTCRYRNNNKTPFKTRNSGYFSQPECASSCNSWSKTCGSSSSCSFYSSEQYLYNICRPHTRSSSDCNRNKQTSRCYYTCYYSFS